MTEYLNLCVVVIYLCFGDFFFIDVAMCDLVHDVKMICFPFLGAYSIWKSFQRYK